MLWGRLGENSRSDLRRFFIVSRILPVERCLSLIETSVLNTCIDSSSRDIFSIFTAGWGGTCLNYCSFYLFLSDRKRAIPALRCQRRTYGEDETPATLDFTFVGVNLSVFVGRLRDGATQSFRSWNPNGQGNSLPKLESVLRGCEFGNQRATKRRRPAMTITGRCSSSCLTNSRISRGKQSCAPSFRRGIVLTWKRL